MSILSVILAVVVSAQLDSTQLKIGDQCDLHLKAIVENEQVQFPVFGEELINGVEVVGRSKIDTTQLKDGRQELSQSLTITSFKDSLFLLPPMGFVSGEDTFLTEQLALNVIQPFEMDTTQNAITDIKDIYKARIWWWGIIRWILLGLLIVGVLIGVYYLVVYLKKHKKNEEEIVEPELLRPAEEVALEKLDNIKSEKIWQQGRQKEYHTQLTDTIREYISRRFEISSQEQTSEEILSDIKPMLSEQKELYQKLKQMLGLADLVKFAKWNPLPDENEKSLTDAYDFVVNTIPSKEEQLEDTKENAES